MTRISSAHPLQGAVITLLALAAGLLAAARPETAEAQDPGMARGGKPEVTAQAAVHLKRTATHLRMYLQLSGKGKTLEEALAALKEQRESVAARVEKLGADKASIVFTDPAVDASVNTQQQRMEAMLAQRMGTRGVKKPAKPVKPPVAVTTMVTVQWPLAGDSTEKLLMAADAVHEKVKGADLAGSKEPAKLSPEEQELAEEAAAEMARNSGGDEEAAKPGQPRFVFVAEISAQDRQKALAQAFAKAKAQAADLAQAAGASLGSLARLSGESSGESTGGMGRYSGFNQYEAREYQYMQQMAYMQQQMEQASGGPDQSNRVLSIKPDGIGFDCVVSATFALENSPK